MRLIIPLFLLFALLTACGPDQQTEVGDDAATLDGRWELTEARRDNVKTNLLNGLYLVFNPDGSFETNLLTNTPQSGTYTQDGTEIVTEGVEVPLTYEVTVLEPDALGLRSRYEGFVFDFMLERPAAGQPEPPTED